jgi:hypothetical protein
MRLCGFLRDARFRSVVLACLALPLGVPTVEARQVTGIPGSPDATTTIDGHGLPPPLQPFTGQIGLNADQSRPAWPMRVVPPKGAPNFLLIMTDDVGFAAPSTFAGVIPTPTLDRTIPIMLPIDETFGIGLETGTPVDDRDYQVPFRFTGKIDKLTITLERPKLTPEDVQKLEAAHRAGQDAN